MPKPVCVKCKRFFKPKKNGVWLMEQMPSHDRAAPGTGEEEAWRPYKVWHADLLVCHGCGTEIIVGFAPQPIAEHFEDNFFRDALATVTHTVNDC
jgi:hypothetical protein